MVFIKQKLCIAVVILMSSLVVVIPREYACATSGKIPMESDSSKNLFAVWACKNNNTECSNIFASIKPIGGSWSTSVQISGTNNKCVDPIIDVAENGNTIALWMATMDDGNNGLVVSTISTVTGSWATEFVITTTSENVVNDWYNVEITSDGVTAIWSSLMVDGGSGELVKVMRTASAPFGGTWSAPTTIP